MELIHQLNAHKWLYLDRLYEETDLELCILVDEAQIVGGELETFDNAIAYGPIVYVMRYILSICECSGGLKSTYEISFPTHHNPVLWFAFHLCR